MTYTRKVVRSTQLFFLISLFCIGTVHAQIPLPDGTWEFEEAYDDQLVFVHSLVNYAFDLEWQFDWERRRLADNGLRLNSGSVSSDELQTLVQLNLNPELNENWHFLARFDRDNARQRARDEDEFLVGLERRIFGSSSFLFGIDPRYDKEFLTAVLGYTFYQDESREKYLRVGVLLEDFQYTGKNDARGEQEQDPVSVFWNARLGSDDWQIVTEGRIGTGFERSFPVEFVSPDLARHDRQERYARVKLNRTAREDSAWTVWVDWYDFSETKLYREERFDYVYETDYLIGGAEYFRLFGDRHRIRLLAQYVEQNGSSRGFRAHDYERSEIVTGVFYEYQLQSNGFTVAYASGLPDIQYDNLVNPDESFTLDEYQDKLIVGWRHDFSKGARVWVSIAHEVSAKGFGGGNVWYQMFF